MKRLGDTAVSPDGKWLAYSVTTVNLDQNTKTPELWLQAIAGGEPIKLAVAQPGDSGPQFAPDGHSVLFLSGRDNRPANLARGLRSGHGRDEQREEADSDCDRGRQRAMGAGWEVDCVHVGGLSGLSGDYDGGLRHRQQMQCGPRCGAGGEQGEGADLHASVLSPLGPLHGRQAVASVSGFGGRAADARSESQRHARCSAVFARGSGCGCDFSPDSKELAFTENLDPEPAISTSTQISSPLI